MVTPLWKAWQVSCGACVSLGLNMEESFPLLLGQISFSDKKSSTVWSYFG